MTALYTAAPCTRKSDPEPGVRLLRMGTLLAILDPEEARSLGADLVICAGTSEGQWDAPAPRAGEPS